MQTLLSIAIIITLLTSVFIIIKFGNLRLKGPNPVPIVTFIAILFTSGLDVGLIMFPLTEFAIYNENTEYQFTNPLAIEFGFWGFLVWGFYFLTTFYFCAIEPKLKLFEIPLIKLINTLIIVSTCAFTGYLFFSYLPDYINNISEFNRYSVLGIVILLAVLSSTKLHYIKLLSVCSTLLFLVLLSSFWFNSNIDTKEAIETTSLLVGYFENLHRFISPITNYHAFYLFWWFAWSIMIGQFVARFVNGVKTWQLLVALLILPSIPIAVWFSILYYYHTNAIIISDLMSISMVIVGIIFVINSLDSLIRLYTENYNLTLKKLGAKKYILINFSILYGLVLMYQMTPFKIEWVGLTVIGLYSLVYFLIMVKRKSLK